MPDPKFLCIEAAKDTKTIEWATQRSISGYIPIPDNLLGNALKEYWGKWNKNGTN